MRNIARLLLFLCLCLPASAIVLTVNWSDFASSNLKVKQVTVTPDAIQTNGSYIVSLDTRAGNTDTNGSISFTNVVPNGYTIDLNNFVHTRFHITITNGTPIGATLNAKDLITTSTNNGGTNAYSMLASDGRYLQINGTNSVTLTNTANAFTGSFTGNGVGLTNLLTSMSKDATIDSVGHLTLASSGQARSDLGLGDIATRSTNEFQAGALALTNLAAGTATALLGTSGTKAAAGNDSRFSNGASLTNVPGTWIDPTRTPYNAAGDGVTDDTVALTNALWAGSISGLPVLLPNKTFKVSPFTMYTNQALFGVNGARLLFSSSSSSYAVTMDYQSTNIAICGIEIDGGKASSIPGSDDGRTGLFFYNVQNPNWVVKNVYIHGFGTGVELYGVGGNLHNPLASLTDCRIQYCWKGMFLNPQSEYMMFSGLQVNENHFGAVDQAGNCTFSACNFADNVIAFSLDNPGGNGGHSSFVGCHFNHSTTYALTGTNVSLGASFSACSFLPPNMNFTTCQGISFENCEIGWSVASFATIAFDHCTNCAILFPQNPYNVAGSYSVTTATCNNIVLQASTGTVANGLSIADAQLTANVALLSGSTQTFAQSNVFSAGISSTAPSTIGAFKFAAVNGPSFYDVGSKFTLSGDSSGFQFNNQVNNTALMNLDNAGGLALNVAGKTLTLTSGSNAKIGTATANGTTAVVVSTTAVTANSLIFLTNQTPGATTGAPFVSAVTANSGFSFKTVAGDTTSVIGWMIVEKQ